MAHDVFISYSSRDKPTADAVCAVLESKGIRCWIAPRDILPGSDWGESIIEAIQTSRVMVLVFSSHANESQQIKREVERAVNRGIPIIPLRIEDVAPTKSLEYFISTPHWLDAFTPPLERHLEYLSQTVRQILAGPVGAEIKPPPRPAPSPISDLWVWLRRPKGLLAAGAALVVLVILLRSVGWLGGSGQPSDGTRSFVGKWEAAEVKKKAVPEGMNIFTLIEMVEGAFSASNFKAKMEVTDVGQYTMNMSGEDRGTVSSSGDEATFTSATSGRSVKVRYFFHPPDNLGYYAQPGEVGFWIEDPRQQRSQSLWLGKPGGKSKNPKLANDLVGAWRVYMLYLGTMGLWNGTLEITPQGEYRFRIWRDETGMFQAESGKWKRMPNGAMPLEGNYVFKSSKMVTLADANDSITWKRVK